MTKLCVTKLCVKDGVCDKAVCDREVGVTKMVCDKEMCVNVNGISKCHALPRETTADATKCHACHAKCCGVTRRHGRPKARHQAQPSPISTRPARKTTVDVAKCHACHVKRPRMPPSATPATQSVAEVGGCHQVPRLPREM